MIRVLLYRAASGELAVGDESLLMPDQRSAGDLIWADFSEHDPTAEAQLLRDTFGLHPLAIHDAQRRRHQPKIEFFRDSIFVLLKGLGPDASDFDFATIQIAMFVSADCFVTRHSGPSPSIDRLWREVQADPSLFQHGVDGLLLQLSRISVDRYTNRLLTLEPRLEDLEGEIIARPKDEYLAELMRYKTDLRQFRRVLVYHVQVFSELLNHSSDFMRPDKQHEIRDVYEHQERASSLATLYFEMATDLIDGYISLASHRLNNIMKVLTIITAIFVPLSFMAGIYGMNFDVMPELKSRYGYFILLAVMGSVATALLLIFRRKRWL